MGDIKLKKGTGILFVMAVLFISSLIYLHYGDQNTLRVGIFYGSNWEVPGTVHYEILDQAIKKFESKYPNVKVEYEKGILSNDYSEWLSEQILKGTEPDVYLVLDEDFNTLASLGALKNLDMLVGGDKEFDFNVFYSSVYKAGQYEGSQYALPMECNPTLMFVNKTLLQKEGIKVPDNDWTWDDFYDICKTIVKDSDGDGQMDQFGCYDYTWLQAVYSNGITPFNQSGTSSNFLDEKFLMTIATLGAILIGEYPEAVAVMLFYEIGELFQGYAINKSRKSIADMMDIKPEYANVIRNNKSQKVDPDEVQIGETIEIKPGERVPLDATVVKGESTLDTSALTGESVPVEVREGANILSGCININGLIIAEVTKEYFDSTVNKVLDLVENASAKKSKSERLITRFSKIYTPIVIGLAVLLAILPPIISGEYNFRVWIFRALSFLVVSCPCAFVISVPLSFFSGIGAASRAGVLIKGGNYLEALSKVDTVVFDKTGTLTKGVFNVQKVVVLDKNIDEDKFISLVAAAESGSNHPISKSIQKYYNKEIDTNSINSIKEISGKGIEAIIDNRKILVGNEKLINIPKDISIDDIGTILYVEIDNKFAGYIVISDELKKDSKKTIKDLKDIGIKKTIMLTGDLEKVSKKVGKDLDLDEVYTNLLPQDKVSKFEEIIENKKSKGNVVFVGDGINDAPVLARADVGIAMGAMGSDAAIEAADVVIMTDEPSKIVTAIKSSKKTMKIAMQNITLAFGIKAIVLILSALGIADMWMAVFADTGVTILAVLNSFRALKIENN